MCAASSAPGRGTPLVSVLLPVYNGGEYLREAVEGVRAQTLQDWELIIIDDGSTDGAVDPIGRINDDRIRIVRQPNRGKPSALNAALAMARGRFYALQDADDVSYPARLERQVAYLEDHPQVAGVFCGHDILLDGRAIAPTFRGKSEEECARDIADGRIPGLDPTGAYRVSLVRDFSYSEDLPVVEGVDYVLRVGEQHPLAVLSENLYGYRVHLESITRSNASRRADMLRQALTRMRARRGQPMGPADEQRVEESLGANGEDSHLISHFTASVADLVGAGRRGEAIRAGLTLWRRGGGRLGYGKPLLYSVLPHGWVRAVKSVLGRGPERSP